MNEFENKNMKTQLSLLNDIIDYDSHILHCVMNEAANIYNNIINSKFKYNDDNVELTKDEFNIIRETLENLKSIEGMRKINSWIGNSYIDPRIEKLKILSMLK